MQVCVREWEKKERKQDKLGTFLQDKAGGKKKKKGGGGVGKISRLAAEPNKGGIPKRDYRWMKERVFFHHGQHKKVSGFS